VGGAVNPDASNVNPANAMTAARFLLLPPFLWAIEHGYPQWAMVMVAISAALDQFDGVVARLCNCVTAFGAVFDAITDAICYGFMMVVLVAYGWVPWPPVGIVVGLGAVNTWMRYRYARRAGRTVNYRSWAMEKIVAFVGFLCGFGVAQIEVDYYFWSCAILMGIVMLHDTKRMLVDPIDDDDDVQAPQTTAPAAITRVRAGEVG
jgi:phosphatidylglycerophosphate synthase